MARPVQANAERTRSRILASASQLFSDKGTGNTSMREIARQAGVTQATVHHYFGSKDDLHAAAVTAMYGELGQLRANLIGLLDGNPDVSTVVGRAVRTAFKFAREHRAAVRMSFRDVIDSHEMPHPQVDQASAMMRDAVPALMALTDLPAERIRFTLQSMVFLIVRYALGTAGEYALIVDGKHHRRKRYDERHVEALADELARTAQRMLGLPSTKRV